MFQTIVATTNKMFQTIVATKNKIFRTIFATKNQMFYTIVATKNQMFQTIVATTNQNTHFILNSFIFPKNLSVWVTMGKVQVTIKSCAEKMRVAYRTVGTADK